MGGVVGGAVVVVVVAGTVVVVVSGTTVETNPKSSVWLLSPGPPVVYEISGKVPPAGTTPSESRASLPPWFAAVGV